MSAEFLDLVKRALFQQTDATVRQEAERQLIHMCENQIDKFLNSCVEGLVASPDLQLKQGCSTLLKRCLGLINSNTNSSYWLSATLETRNFVKNNLLGLLAITEKIVRRSAADCISGICAIELPRNEWPEIIDRLVVNTSNTQTEYRMAAITALGFICEALKSINMKECIDSSQAEKILYGICQGMKKEETEVEIKSVAVKALQDSLSFMEQQFAKKEVRDFVTAQLLENVACDKKELKIVALQCLIDFVKQLYFYLNEYIQAIIVATVPSIQDKDKEIAIPAIEVWTSLSIEIKELQQKQIDKKLDPLAIPNYVQLSFPNLVPLFLQNLLKQDEDDLDEDDEVDLTIQEGSYKALAATADIVGQQCFSLYTNFIEQALNQNEWEKRKAAVLAFGTLIERQDDDFIQQLAFSALEQFVIKLSDTNQKVYLATSRVLAKVAENYPVVFFSHPNCIDLLQKIMNACQKRDFGKNIIWLLVNLTENFEKYSQSVLSKESQGILQFLAILTTRQDITNENGYIITLAFTGILNIIHSVRNPEILINYMDEFIRSFTNLSSMPSWRKLLMEDGLLSVIQGCIVRLKIFPNSENYLEQQKIDFIYQQVIHHFKSIQDVSSYGIHVIAALASCKSVKLRFLPYIKEFMGYLQHSITKVQEQEIFKATIYCISDIARSIGSEFQQYINILDYYIQFINNQQYDRELKIHVYSSMGDVVIGLGLLAQPYCNQILSCLHIGCQAAIKLSSSTDYSHLDYADRLKEVLLQCYQSLLYSLNDRGKVSSEIYSTLPLICVFIKETTVPQLKPTVQYVRLCLNYLVDFATFYQQSNNLEMKQLIASQELQELARKIQQFQDNPDNKEILDYYQMMLKRFGCC